MPRAVARQVVSESGNSTLARAWPAASVTTSAAQKAVSGNALRILGCTRRSGFSCARRERGRSSASRMRRLPASPLKKKLSELSV